MSGDDWNHYGDGLDSRPNPIGDDGMNRQERRDVVAILLGVAVLAALILLWESAL